MNTIYLGKRFATKPVIFVGTGCHKIDLVPSNNELAGEVYGTGAKARSDRT